MPLTTCQVCERRFKDDREDCPYCGALSASKVLPKGPRPGGGGGSSKGWKRAAIPLLAALVVVNLWRGLSGDAGPDPELEALHSEEEAVLICREAIESEMAEQDPSFLGPERPEYLQGGEYSVVFPVEIQDGRRRTRAEILCEAQFTPETGWIVEEVSVVTG